MNKSLDHILGGGQVCNCQRDVEGWWRHEGLLENRFLLQNGAVDIVHSLNDLCERQLKGYW